MRANWSFTTDSLRSTDCDPAKPPRLSLDASLLLLKCQVGTNRGRGRLLDASPRTADKGSLCYLEWVGGLPILEIVALVLRRASGKGTNTNKYPKAFIYFRTSRRGTDGMWVLLSRLWESRKSSFLAGSPQKKKIQHRTNSHSPGLNQSGEQQRDDAPEVSGKTGLIKGSLCVCLTYRLCGEKHTS